MDNVIIAQTVRRELDGTVTAGSTVAARPRIKKKRESCLNCGMPLEGFDDIVCSPECAEKEAG